MSECKHIEFAEKIGEEFSKEIYEKYQNLLDVCTNHLLINKLKNTECIEFQKSLISKILPLAETFIISSYAQFFYLKDEYIMEVFNEMIVTWKQNLFEELNEIRKKLKEKNDG